MGADPVSAGIGAAGSILGGIAGGKGASKAAKIQAAAYQKGIDAQTAEFNQTQQNFAPYLQAGDTSLSSLLGLLGLGSGGATQQQSAIDALKSSPLFTSQYNTGADTLLQNAAATGGLRGGNTENSLANFGSSLLSNVIQNQVGNLGNLVSIGSGDAGNLGSLGQQNASAVSNLLGQQGGANATAAAAPYAAFQQILKGLGSSSSGLSSLFGGGGGGLSSFNGYTPSGTGIDSPISTLSGYTPKYGW